MLPPDGRRRPRAALTRAQYLAREAVAGERSAFHDGELYAMAGGSQVHALLVANVARVLGNAPADQPCAVASPDLRVQIDDDNLTYPDVSVLCPPVEAAPGDPHSVLNPSVLVEVLSPGTVAWDRGGKFALYRRIPALQHYLLVASDCWSVEHFRRQADGSWRLTEHGPAGVVTLDALGVHIAVDALYVKLDLVGGPTRETKPPARPTG